MNGIVLPTDTEIRFRNNATALYVAAFKNHVAMARLLLNFSADVNDQTK